MSKNRNHNQAIDLDKVRQELYHISLDHSVRAVDRVAAARVLLREQEAEEGELDDRLEGMFEGVQKMAASLLN